MKMDPAVVTHWKHAADIDKSLLISKGLLRDLARHELRPESYSRRKFFSAMARQEVILFHNFPLKYSLQPFFSNRHDPASRLKPLFKGSTKTLTRSGRAKRVKYLPVQQVIDIWQRGRAIFSANDIFFRNLELDRAFDCGAISDFNVIPTAPPRIRRLEVATLLMGTVGCMTDSHSDDPDGTNHCILGKKLWLIWDRREGARRGLQDCEYDDVYTHAKFNLEAFLTLRTAKWFTVSNGQTLFMPGNHTHKVITLEKYVGLSSFYVGLPNALSSLTRWMIEGTTMVTERLRHTITKLVIKQLAKTAAGSRQLKERWGFYHLEEALSYWEQKYTNAQRQKLRSDPHFRELADKITSLCR